MVGEVGGDRHHRPRRDEVPQHLGVLDGRARDRGHRRHQAQRLLHHQVQRPQLRELLVADRVARNRQGLLAAPLLPLRVLAQVLHHRRDGDRGRVVRGHEQEDHVVDDVVVAEALAVDLHPAQHGEQIVAVARPPCRQVLAEELLHSASTDQAAVPTPARHGIPHESGRRLDTVDERGVDLIEARLAGAGGAAHEYLHREVQRQLFEPGIDLHALPRLPLLDGGADRRVDRCRVPGEAVGGERLLHEAAVGHVLVEAQEHQTTVEERPDEELPRLTVGERLVPVLEDHSRRLRPEQRDDPRPERSEPRDRTVPVIALVPQPHGIPQVVQTVTEER